MSDELEPGQAWEYDSRSKWCLLLLRRDPETDEWLTLTLWDDMEPAGEVGWYAAAWILDNHVRLA